MCAECLSSPCRTGCPNESERKIISSCGRCSDAIFAGDEYWSNPDGEPLCESCVDDMTTKELLEYLGYELRTVGEDDYD